MEESRQIEELDTWATVELITYQTVAGRSLVEYKTVAGRVRTLGSGLIRVDIPESQHYLAALKKYLMVAAYTRYFGLAVVHAVTPCSEEYAREVIIDTKAPLGIPFQLIEPMTPNVKDGNL
jgi:hypothetical protein